MSSLTAKRIPLDLAYAATQVNATVFRVSSVVSSGGFQYATFYDPDGAIVVAQRRLPSEKWETALVPGAKGNVRDAHNGVVIGVSSEGILHLSYDHHAHPLRYRRTARPHDIRAWGEAIPMTGKTEDHVTYPQFVSAPDGTFYFFYRDGSSGNGNLCLNRWEKGVWKVLYHPLVDGQNKCNPYWWRPSFGPDGSLHLAWCWRDTGDARTNHDLCYARTSDRGETWQGADNKRLPLPINPANAYVADPIPTGSNLINQCSSSVDGKNRPHLAHYQNDDKGLPQYTHLWHDGKKWQRNVVSQREKGFSLSGGGTLYIPISRPEIAITKNNTVYFITRDAELGGGIRLFRACETDGYKTWEAIDLIPLGGAQNLGEWEPTYDAVRLRENSVLSLYVQRVQQGNHETVTTLPPQEAALWETTLDD